MNISADRAHPQYRPSECRATNDPEDPLKKGPGVDSASYPEVVHGWSTGHKPYEFIGFGDLHGPKSYKFIGFGDLHGPKPYEFIGLGFLAKLTRNYNPKFVSI